MPAHDSGEKQKRTRFLVEVVMLGSLAVASLQVFFDVGFAPPVVRFLALPLFGDDSYFLRADVQILGAVFGVWLLQAATLAVVPALLHALTGLTIVELAARARSKK